MLLSGQADIEAVIVEIDHVIQRCRVAPMEVWRTSPHTTQDGDFHPPEVSAQAGDQTLTAVCGVELVTGHHMARYATRAIH